MYIKRARLSNLLPPRSSAEERRNGVMLAARTTYTSTGFRKLLTAKNNPLEIWNHDFIKKKFGTMNAYRPVRRERDLACRCSVLACATHKSRQAAEDSSCTAVRTSSAELPKI